MWSARTRKKGTSKGMGRRKRTENERTRGGELEGGEQGKRIWRRRTVSAGCTNVEWPRKPHINVPSTFCLLLFFLLPLFYHSYPNLFLTFSPNFLSPVFSTSSFFLFFTFFFFFFIPSILPYRDRLFLIAAMHSKFHISTKSLHFPTMETTVCLNSDGGRKYALKAPLKRRIRETWLNCACIKLNGILTRNSSQRRECEGMKENIERCRFVSLCLNVSVCIFRTYLSLGYFILSR